MQVELVVDFTKHFKEQSKKLFFLLELFVFQLNCSVDSISHIVGEMIHHGVMGLHQKNLAFSQETIDF